MGKYSWLAEKGLLVQVKILQKQSANRPLLATRSVFWHIFDFYPYF